ncbi:MAG: hypothetical protein BMS9Abin08_1413 [Gammaproteobacteria bacterium]|nr:MAG: hypothetical protein BMS9Abin08_1413 [Gammaproteobacteria bacterium]
MYPPVLAPALRLTLFLWATLLPAASIAENTDRPPLLAKLEELTEVSAGLVREARSTQAEATPFRIAVTLYREHLRTLMLDDRKISDEKDRIPQGILVNMVRMSALLYSAAECKTGRYIVCPPELMRKLASQQQLLSKDLDSFKVALDGTG